MPLTGKLLEVARTHPGRVAIASGGQRLGYAQLVEDSRRLMAAVREVQAGQRQPPEPVAETGGIPIVAVSVASAFEAARILAGLAGYRCVSATIDPRWPLAHRVNVVRSAGIGVVVSDSADLGEGLRAAGWRGTVLAPAALHALESDAEPAEAPAVRDGREPFLMLFSSGTTRNPKAFLKTRRQYRENYAVSAAYLEPLPGVATLAPGPVSYSLTLYAVIECLASGGSAYLADAFDPIRAAQTIAECRITRIVAVPAMVRAMAVEAQREPARFTSVKLIITGGANLPTSTRAALARAIPGARVISYYGAAEIGFIGDSRGADGSVIQPYRGIEVALRRDDGTVIARGEEELGTIWVRAAACSDGYVAGTSAEPLREAAGWATVHDQGRWVAEGLKLVGRAGDVAITGGHKVSLAEVERAFDDAPGAPVVCAVAMPDARRGAIVALVVEAEGDVDKRGLVALAQRRLAPQFVPRQWYSVPTLPRTVGGKLRRAAAAELVASGAAQRL